MLGWLKKDRRMVGPETAFRRVEHVLAATEGERTVLLDPVRGEYLGLDEVGTRIWELLPAHPTPAALSERLADEYDAPRETLVADAARLLGELAAMNVVARA
jgi:hypothetical protein